MVEEAFPSEVIPLFKVTEVEATLLDVATAMVGAVAVMNDHPTLLPLSVQLKHFIAVP